MLVMVMVMMMVMGLGYMRGVAASRLSCLAQSSLPQRRRCCSFSSGVQRVTMSMPASLCRSPAGVPGALTCCLAFSRLPSISLNDNHLLHGANTVMEALRVNRGLGLALLGCLLVCCLQAAMSRNGNHMGPRYVELFASTQEEIVRHMNRT